MKYAVIGKGKTGGQVIEILKSKKLDFTVFDTQNIPTFSKLKSHDVIISFLPGEAFLNLIPLLLETKIPVVTGSTGMSFPINFNETLKELNLKWIYATNFSLGMNLVSQMIEVLKNASKLLEEYEIKITETHHTKKLDAPSGTALSWKSWSGHETPIESIRIDDVIGIHTLSLQTKTEEITLTHNALDRKIFASGAIFAADKMITQTHLKPGLYLFQDFVKQELLTPNI